MFQVRPAEWSTPDRALSSFILFFFVGRFITSESSFRRCSTVSTHRERQVFTSKKKSYNNFNYHSKHSLPFKASGCREHQVVSDDGTGTGKLGGDVDADDKRPVHDRCVSTTVYPSGFSALRDAIVLNDKIAKEDTSILKTDSGRGRL